MFSEDTRCMFLDRRNIQQIQVTTSCPRLRRKYFVFNKVISFVQYRSRPALLAPAIRPPPGKQFLFSRGHLMKRHIPGLHRDSTLEGVFLVRVDRGFYSWHPTRPFYLLRFSVLEPKEHAGHYLTGRIYCTPKSPVAAELVLAGLQLQHRSAASR